MHPTPPQPLPPPPPPPLPPPPFSFQNLPFSSGRALGKSDDNELIILKVTDLLKAK